ncbi:hypothetical protein [Brachybacterium sp. YJGR34]|uniref:Ig-like domain-containing protein n=1 Tax=Brachybacterium sp. YJGR34 TaxID=2059911 RepID=UPI000E0C208C|nr:hypothetical protein [Brachybacterium sp. YJGR34]
MLEPSPRPRPRPGPSRPVARLAALAASGALALSLSLPASALGEDGPFEFPVESDALAMIPGSATRLPLDGLIQDDLEAEVVPDSARLAIPEDVAESARAPMELEDDGRSIVVSGEGTWSLLGTDLVFTPLVGVEGPSSPIALTIESVQGVRSLPVTLTPDLLELEEISAHGSADEPTSIALEGGVPSGGTVHLELAGLPAGSTVTADGSRAIVPDQGLWQLSADGGTLRHTPAAPGLGRQVDPVRLAVTDEEGTVVSAAEVSLTVPIISDLDWSAPFGEDILFVVGEGQQYVDPSTLRLQPLGGVTEAESATDGTRVVIHGEGTWALDRESATVRFTPESDQVRETAPMGIVGGDGEGASASTALLSTAYPILRDRSLAGIPGRELSFDLSTGIRDVRSDSLRFDPEAVPEGGTLSEDRTELVVEGEGTWTIDLASRSLVMTPEESFTGTAASVGITARGVYADNPVEATFEATFSPVIATLRDDEGRTAPRAPITVDVLGNDTAGSGSQPLEPESVELSSLAATNITELDEGRGTRLVIPGEGEYTVGANGAITFTPEQGFTGRTTPIAYHVRDSAGIPATANLVVDVDPEFAASTEQGADVAGINSLLVGLTPASPGTAIVFGTIVLLLLYSGGVSLWIGLRMEADRRAWED